jgi:hypothetical protein
VSLDVSISAHTYTTVYTDNITHNLGKMAQEAGVYYPLWRPEEIGLTKAGELVPFLRAGLHILKAKPEEFRVFDAPNGWGRHEHLVAFLEAYLSACESHPDGDLEVSR